jgi:ATP-dependent DNA helicase RecG
MNSRDVPALLDELLAAWENEIIEFKQAGNDYDTAKIGQYFSALANEANIRGRDAGWLVFGVNDKTRSVVGTEYRREIDRLHSLKGQIAQGTEPSTTFREIHELDHAGGRVILFEVPPAPRGMPISWNGHYYARDGESLSHLGLDKLDEIRAQTIDLDWSARPVDNATFDDLDEDALARARESFAQKHANRLSSSDVLGWPVSTFTDRAKLTQNGRITRAALLLLGKAESAWRLSPHPAQLTWRLEGPENAYEHFGPPFLLTTSQLFQRIRNIQLRLLPQDELLPTEVSKYDQRTVLEALHNCIAHQDYTRHGRVAVRELPDRLVFENEGSFFEGQPDDYVEGSMLPLRYRNPFLTRAMVELNMIDTMGYGIHSMYSRQAQRYLPLPDFDLSQSNSVRLTVYGSVVDPAYSRLLMQHTELSLADVLALDRVQKGLAIRDDALQRLRRAKLIEGRRPHLHVAASIAAATESKAQYIRARSQDDAHFAKLVTDYLDRFGTASRRDIERLLWDKLSDVLTDPQRATKISNLLSKMKRSGVIRNDGSRTKSSWVREPLNAESSKPSI